MVFSASTDFPIIITQSVIYKIDDVSFPVATLKTISSPSLPVPLIRYSVELFGMVFMFYMILYFASVDLEQCSCHY